MPRHLKYIYCVHLQTIFTSNFLLIKPSYCLNLKVVDTIKLLKIFIKPYLVTSNGERLRVSNIVRNGSLWSDVVFEKGVNFHEFDFETSDLEFGVSKSNIWKHTTSCYNGVFSFIVISQLRRPIIELKFSQVCYFMRYTNTNSEE